MSVTEEPLPPSRNSELRRRWFSHVFHSPAQKHKVMSFVLRFAVAVILVAIILAFVDVRAAVGTIVDSDWRYVPPILMLAFADRYLMAFKWAMLLRTRGTSISNVEAFRIYLMSGFVGAFLPSGMGADVYKLARTTLATRRPDSVAASILMERIIGLLALTTLALIGVSFLVKTGKNQFAHLLWVVLSVMALAIAAIVISISGGVSKWIKEKASPFQKYKIIRLAVASHEAYMELGRRKRVLVWFFFLSLLEYVLVSLIAFCCALALNLSINFLYFVVVVPVTIMAASVPISVAGIGVFEGLYIILFGLAGLGNAQTFSLTVFIRAIQMLVLIPGGVLALRDTFRSREPTVRK
jgi:glycosyltransferase 2 family protein